MFGAHVQQVSRTQVAEDGVHSIGEQHLEDGSGVGAPLRHLVWDALEQPAAESGT